MILNDLISYLEEIAPPHLQESYDNSGLIYGHPDLELTGALVSLDCTEDVVDEAISLGFNLIVSHHPIVFSGIKKFSHDNYVHRVVINAIQHNIAIYAIHTNLDNVLEHGVNQKIAQKIGLTQCTILRPKDSAEPHTGSGIIGELHNPIDPLAFMDHLKGSMNLKTIKHTALLTRPVQRVAVCGGAGSFLLVDAKAAGADVFITADYKYHEFFDADGILTIVDIGHYESEYFTIELLFELLTEKFPKFAARSTKVVTNPISYY